MTVSKLKKPAPWIMERAFLSFSAVIIAFLLIVSLFAFGGVDLWAQTLTHTSLWLLLLYNLWKTPDPIFIQVPTRSQILWVALLVVIGVSTLRSGAIERSEQEWWMWADYFLIYVLGSRLTEEQRTGIIQSILAASLLLCVWGWYQALVHHQLPEGSLLNSNIFAGYLLIPLFLAAERWKNNRTLASSLIVFALAATILFSRSWGALISLLVAGAYVSFKLPNYRQWLITLFSFGLLAIILAATKLYSAWDIHRLTWWRSCIEMAACHPIWGNGPGTFDIALARRSDMTLFSLYAHSSWLQWLSEIGLLGVVGVLFLTFYCIRKQTNIFISAGMMAVLIHNAVDYSLLIPAQALLFWLVASFSETFKTTIIPRKNPLEARFFTGRLALSLVCICATWHVMNRFQADRHYVNAVHWAVQKDWPRAQQEIQTAMILNPTSSRPYALLANIALIRSTNPPNRAALQMSLAYVLNALEHEPIQPAYWAQALALCTKLSLPENIMLLHERLSRLYPFLLEDKRVQLYFH